MFHRFSRHEEGRKLLKSKISVHFPVNKSLSNDDVGMSKGHRYFRRYDRELVPKLAFSLKKSRGRGLKQNETHKDTKSVPVASIVAGANFSSTIGMPRGEQNKKKKNEAIVLKKPKNKNSTPIVVIDSCVNRENDGSGGSTAVAHFSLAAATPPTPVWPTLSGT